MASKKELKVMFFYADENVFENVKKWNTRDRLIKWADEFFERYGFKINPYPSAWNEQAYKKLYCLDKTNGLKGISVLSDLNDYILKKIEHLQAQIDFVYQSIEEPSKEEKEEHLFYNSKIIKLYTEAANFSNAQSNNELNFRIKVQQHIDKHMFFSSIKQNFVHVIFCNFITQVGDISPILDDVLEISKELKIIKDSVAALTFSNAIHKRPQYVMTDKKIEFSYLYPIVLIDIKSITKNMNYVLAHELVHVAGGTTADNAGKRGNIMIYEDAEGKIPKAVNLEINDQKRIEIAFYTS